VKLIFYLKFFVDGFNSFTLVETTTVNFAHRIKNKANM